MEKAELVAKQIVEIANTLDDLDEQKLNTIKKKVAKEHHFKDILTNIQILTHIDNKDMQKYKFLITKPTRTISGVAVIAIMAMPLNCPHGRCTYCPGGLNSYFGSVPQSYTGKEPATMRAIRNSYDPYLQIMNRLEQYVIIGQVPEKVELILMGGTFPAYPKKYRDEFIYQCFKAMNDFSRLFYQDTLNITAFKEFFELPGNVDNKERTEKINKKLLEIKNENSKTLQEEQTINETSKIKCIGLTIETKPDWGKDKIGSELLEYGCTRIELGIQTVYDEVLEQIHRGHTIQDTIDSVRMLKDLGFKLNFHMMPGLPGISKEKDIAGLKEIFNNPNYRPDMLKVYPTMVFPGTPLQKDFEDGKFIPLTTEQAADIITEFKQIVPRYCRIMRVQRDIPTILGKGVTRNNLRQYIEQLMKEKGYTCNCIRCREIKQNKIQGNPEFEIIEYNASEGKEFFISLKDDNDKLLGFCRLRFPSELLRKEITNDSALIRELHVYGSAVSVGKKESEKAQHKGFGTQLMEKAEEIAKQHKKNKMIVISGVGVRGYYRKLGYALEGPYMVKALN
ncbi:tRNA uridine(34) 5-carboxymethylaminomethyl modification radical SAM/GNAT enzyme Elp3 [Candidatus Woesearchaeota archaeon]|nr:MAG: tRNA uridine(34) 5-carboxymethylaminomethyl modification radical SAM/GNAT enzyme Elp3 [Candidatus Woesearchaeota archaeon]